MKDEKKTEIRVGLTVLFGILLFIWIFGWAKNISLKSTEQDINIRFDNVAVANVSCSTVSTFRNRYKMFLSWVSLNKFSFVLISIKTLILQ